MMEVAMTDLDPALLAWGLDERWAAAAAPLAEQGVLGRIVAVDRGAITLRLAQGEVRGIWRPARCGEAADRPTVTVGDWCIARPSADDGPAVVHTALPRRTTLTRKAAGRTARSQLLAANTDVVALVCGLDRDQGIRSLERLLALTLDGGAMPMVVLNKADLCDAAELRHQIARARLAAPGFEVVAVSATVGTGMDELRSRLVSGRTAVMLGPSGVGKSTLINALSGDDVAATSAVRDGDRRGRHTTVRRQLYRLPTGALLVDTPGLRELAAWIDGDGVRRAFADIEQLARDCKFRDCRHDDEPGCAVRRALDDGDLEPRRFWRYLDLVAEAEANRRRRDARQRANTTRRFTDSARLCREMARERKRRW